MRNLLSVSATVVEYGYDDDSRLTGLTYKYVDPTRLRCDCSTGPKGNASRLNDPVKYQEFVKKIPMGRWGELDELAGAIEILSAEV